MSGSLLIRHGSVHDGQRFLGSQDVLVEDERIVEIGILGDDCVADEVLDATGAVVSPGFIDVHDMTYEVEQLHRNDAINLTAQGITTCLIGNCGNSGIWNSADAFLRQTDLLRGAQLGVNVGNLVGHNSLRQFVLGKENARDATPFELERMVSLLGEALDYGALGMSTGLMYSPGQFATRDELIALVSAVGMRGKTYATHIRDEGDRFSGAILEALDIAAGGNAPLLISHYKVAGKRNWGKTSETTRLIESRRLHQPVHLSFYLYDTTSTWLRADLPAEVVQQIAGDYTRLAYSPEDEIAVEERGLHTLCANGWEDVVIASSTVPDIRGQSISALAGGQSCYRTVVTILQRDPNTRVVFHHVSSVDELLAVAALPYAMPASDGYVYPTGAQTATHPRNYGAFARVLFECVTQRGLLTLDDFIRRATLLPSKTFGIKERGQLRKGYFADVAIFRPMEVRDRADYERPYLLSTGVEYTLVNGQVVFAQGHARESFPGRYIS